MLMNDQGHIFVGKRIDTRLDAWQMPQGGIDPGETVEQAAFREMEEEIGTARATLLHISPGWFSYDLPTELVPQIWDGAYRGQKQRWCLMHFQGQEADINIQTQHPEFSAWKWVEPESLHALIVPFKQEIYRQVVQTLQPHIQTHLAHLT